MQASLLNGKTMQLELPKSYCECWSYQSAASKSACQCGEADSREREWIWEPSEYPTTKVSDDEVSVIFHPVYSQGTGMVRNRIQLTTYFRMF